MSQHLVGHHSIFPARKSQLGGHFSPTSKMNQLKWWTSKLKRAISAFKSHQPHLKRLLEQEVTSPWTWPAANCLHKAEFVHFALCTNFGPIFDTFTSLNISQTCLDHQRNISPIHLIKESKVGMWYVMMDFPNLEFCINGSKTNGSNSIFKD